MFEYCSESLPPEGGGVPQEEWWARFVADLEVEGLPVDLEERPPDEVEAYLSAFPDEAPLITMPSSPAWVGSAHLNRLPGVELTSDVVDLLSPDAVERLSAEELVAVVAAAHRSANWWSAVRARATALLAEQWTFEVSRAPEALRGPDPAPPAPASSPSWTRRPNSPAPPATGGPCTNGAPTPSVTCCSAVGHPTPRARRRGHLEATWWSTR